MYEQKIRNTGNIKIFGIKLFEIEKLDTEVFEREFVSDEDTQPLLYDYSTAVYKFFGIPILKFGANYNPNGKTEATYKPEFDTNLTLKNITIAIGTILILLLTFVCGVYTANSEWYNSVLYRRF